VIVPFVDIGVGVFMMLIIEKSLSTDCQQLLYNGKKFKH
jgi:hypothetical protein